VKRSGIRAGVRAGIQRDAAKVRDWQDRSRTPLAKDSAKALKRSAPLRATSALEAQGREGMRSSGLRRAFAGQGPHGEQLVEAEPAVPPELTMQKALATRFQARVRASGQLCFKCGRSADAWHHWVPQEHLRVWMRGLAREAGWSPQETRRRLRGWLLDERNLSAVCIGCHGNATTTHAREFSRADVPLSAVSFARVVDDQLAVAGRPREALLRLLETYP
jgi:hypothetical protein